MGIRFHAVSGMNSTEKAVLVIFVLLAAQGIAGLLLDRKITVLEHTVRQQSARIEALECPEPQDNPTEPPPAR